VRVKPRASRDALEGVAGERVVVRVQAPPLEGRANAAVERLLAKALGVPPGRVTVVSGLAGREKLVRVDGVAAETLAARLGGGDPH